jgi:hypothetical protein
MEKILIMLALSLGTLSGTASAQEKSFEKMELAALHAPKFVQPSEENYAELPKQKIRILVEFVVDEEGRNYVVYINSNKPEVNQKIIKMVEQIPATKEAEGKSNQMVIEYEL